MNSETSDTIDARVIREWISGERTSFSRIFFVAAGANPAIIEEKLSSGDAVLLPADLSLSPTPAKVVTYSGQIVDAGDEIFIGELGVELQDYISAGFIDIVGPTAVRFFDEDGWQAFLEDADLARRTGVFPSALIDPRVVLADRDMVMASNAETVPQALRLESDGTIWLGMQGRRLASSDELGRYLEEPVSRTEALGAVVPAPAVGSDLARRVWLPRYLNATDLMKMLRFTNGTSKISGFGWVAFEDGNEDSEPVATDPFLIKVSGELILADIASRRRQLLTPLTADVVAALQTSSSLELASGRVAARHNIDDATATALCWDAMTLLSVNLGHPKAAPLVGPIGNLQ